MSFKLHILSKDITRTLHKLIEIVKRCIALVFFFFCFSKGNEISSSCSLLWNSEKKKCAFHLIAISVQNTLFLSFCVTGIGKPYPAFPESPMCIHTRFEHDFEPLLEWSKCSCRRQCCPYRIGSSSVLL